MSRGCAKGNQVFCRRLLDAPYLPILAVRQVQDGCNIWGHFVAVEPASSWPSGVLAFSSTHCTSCQFPNSEPGDGKMIGGRPEPNLNGCANHSQNECIDVQCGCFTSVDKLQ